MNDFLQSRRVRFQRWHILGIAVALCQTVQAQNSATAPVGGNGEESMALRKDWTLLKNALAQNRVSPEDRIRAVENWRRANKALGERLRPLAGLSINSLQEPSAALRQRPPSSGRNEAESELFNFRADVGTRIREIQGRRLSPAERIAAVGDFLRLAEGAFADAAVLRSEIVDAGAAKDDQIRPARFPARSPAESVLLAEMDRLHAESQALRSELREVSAEGAVERLAVFAARRGEKMIQLRESQAALRSAKP